jgi:hypothetical protein
MKKRGPGGDDPQQPTDPGPTKEEFVNAYSHLRFEIRKEIDLKLEEYFHARPGPHRMNRKAREVAASAYEAASGVTEFRKRMVEAVADIVAEV